MILGLLACTEKPAGHAEPEGDSTATVDKDTWEEPEFSCPLTRPLAVTGVPDRYTISGPNVLDLGVLFTEAEFSGRDHGCPEVTEDGDDVFLRGECASKDLQWSGGWSYTRTEDTILDSVSATVSGTWEKYAYTLEGEVALEVPEESRWLTRSPARPVTGARS
jgi:hypothetical protein